ncbi:hypothetical protein OESDEN_22873 [Oesophagostomum dentatum]|uniref:Uncharacterized protein n=1 Tax=Oesophagostomum dentatum TaxID=61180 RepID=A0A0B1S201_OESDE|nr:hypothetical protein OESDEN_22873 [Oesophagostomum dentatum]
MNPTPIAYSHTQLQATSQMDAAQLRYLREYEQYQQQMVEYQKQLAEYHVKLSKYQGEMQQYQMQRQYKTALDQAAFQNAYNYNAQSQDVSAESSGSNTAADIADRMNNYGYIGPHPRYSASMGWRTLCDDTATYDTPVAARDYFDRLVLIWRTQSQSVNRRLFGSATLEHCCDEHHAAYQNASQLFDAGMLDKKCTKYAAVEVHRSR